MRKIRLSDTDVELFDIEIAPTDYNFYVKHKDAFKTMWREQGKPFWTRYVITFRSFTVKHGVIKQMDINSPKFENLIDQAFIFIHEQFVDGKERMAKNFIEDIAKLAQNQDKFPALDSKSFAKDPFYLRDTRELFRSFFGMPDQKSSYLKVYILCPIFMRFGGSVCRCLEKWLTAEIQEDPNDDSYWIPPKEQTKEKPQDLANEICMCDECVEDCGEKFFKEKIDGQANGPQFLKFWKLGDPRFNDPDNPLFAPHMDPLTDWRNSLTAETFKEFLYYAKDKYGSDEDKCQECTKIRNHRDSILKIQACKRAELVAECQRQNQKKKEKEEEKEEEVIDLNQIEGIDLIKDKVKQMKIEGLEEMDLNNVEKETAINLTTTMLNLMKPTNDDELKRKEKSQEEKRQKQLRKRQRRKEKKAQARMENSQKDEVVSSRDRASQVDSDDDGDDDDNDGGNGDDTVGALKIERDDKKGVISVTVKTSQDNKGKKNGLTMTAPSRIRSLPDGVSLSLDLLREQISGLPKYFEFWEGAGFLIAVLNYDFEEKDECDKPTNFTIKVAGVTNRLHEGIIVKLLFYVQKRKKRKSLGWNMEADDVVACILPEEDPQLAGLTVTIIRGNFFKAKLTKKERASLKESLPVKKILMMLEPSVAQEFRDDPNGKDRLMNIIYRVCSNDSKREKVKKFNDLWDKLLENPTKFDFVLTCNSSRIDDLKKLGMRQLDVSYEDFMAANCPSVTICRNCCKIEEQCTCHPNKKDLSPVSNDVGFAVHNHRCGGDSVWALRKEDDDDVDSKKNAKPGSEPLPEDMCDRLLEKVLVDLKHKVGQASPYDINQRLIHAITDPTIRHELNAVLNSTDEEFLTKKLLELSGRPGFFDELEEKEVIRETIHREPSPPNCQPVPGMTKNFNLSVTNGCKESVFNVKLEAYEKEGAEKQDEKDRDERLNQKAAEIKQALENVSGFQWTETSDPATDASGYCDKHRPAAEKKSPKKGNSPTNTSGYCDKQKPKTEKHYCDKHKPATEKVPELVGFGPSPQNFDDIIAKTAASAKANHRPVQFKIGKVRVYASEDETGVYVPNQIEVDLKDLNLTPNLSEKVKNKASSPTNKNGSTKSPSNEKSRNKDAKDDTAISLLEASSYLAEATKDINWGKLHGNKDGAKTKKTKDKKESGTEKSGKENKSGVTRDDKEALRHCGHCRKEEPRRKAFKKCQKCKEEGVKNVKYYCGRECQSEDWRLKHKMEHKDKLLG